MNNITGEEIRVLAYRIWQSRLSIGQELGPLDDWLTAEKYYYNGYKGYVSTYFVWPALSREGI